MRFMDKQHWDACNIIYQARLYHDLNMELDATTASENLEEFYILP